MKKKLKKLEPDPKETKQPDVEELRAESIEEILDSTFRGSIVEAGLQEKLTEEDQQRLLKVIKKETVKLTTVQISSGPLPLAEELEHYEKVLTGAADRIVKMGEKEQEHRHSMDQIPLNAEVKYSELGMKLGAGLLVVLVLGAGYGGFIDNVVLIGACLGVGVLSVILGFLRVRIFN